MFSDCEKCRGRSVGSRVIDSRQSTDDKSIRRRRECIECGKRFTTRERVEEHELIVIKKDGSTQEYDKSKIISGMLTASIKQIENIVFLIEKELIDSGKREVATADIGDSVIRHLYSVDQVAYIRFASVYRSFDDLSEFLSELNKILDK